MNYFKKHKRGFIGTIIVHAIVLVLLLLFGFFTPLPYPEEEGIIVNFGNSDQGSGPVEPAPSRRTSPPEVREEEKQVAPPPATPPQPTPKASQPEAKEEVMTQDFEETAAIEAAKKKKEEDTKRQQQLERERKLEEQRKQAELKVQREAELERQRRAELERQRLAEEAEQKRKAEEERKRIEAEQQKIAEINSRASNAFGSGGAGSKTSESTGQGAIFPGGNQGSFNGSANSTNYAEGGGEGNGPSFDLKGRSSIGALPKPDFPGNEEVVVVVRIRVDKSGKVTSAEPGVQGSDTQDAQFLKEAKQAALKARFNDVSDDPSASAIQEGTITYRFVLE